MNDEKFTFCNGIVQHRSQVEHMFGIRWMYLMEKLALNFEKADVDISAFACVSALTLISGK